jgi:probable HAF family extracellular repeat protein
MHVGSHSDQPRFSKGGIVMRFQVFRCLGFVGLLVGVSAGTWAAPMYNFTTIDVPGSTFTQALGINNAGQIVGDFMDATGRFHGFLKDGATITIIDVPGAFPGSTRAFGINDAGQIVGTFGDATGAIAFSKTARPSLRLMSPARSALRPQGSTTRARSWGHSVMPRGP